MDDRAADCRDAWTDPRPTWGARRSRRLEASDGVRIHVDELGRADDQSIVFVHGGGASRLAWDKQFPAFADDFHVVAPDLRGHGLSEKPQSAGRMGRDLACVLEALDLTDVVLVGWSRGSVVVLDYVATHGTGRIRGINFVGAHPGVGAGLSPYVNEAFGDLPDGPAGDEQFVWALFSEDPTPPEYSYFLAMRLRYEPASHRRTFHVDVLPEIEEPVLLTHGECDAVVNPSTVETFADGLPEATVSMYPGVGHMPFWDAPERFNAELRSFALSPDDQPDPEAE